MSGFSRNDRLHRWFSRHGTYLRIACERENEKEQLKLRTNQSRHSLETFVDRHPAQTLQIVGRRSI